MSLTAAQQEAVAARGNVLVVAGAGTGKTRTLVERCLECLLHGNPRASLEEILIVTFTEAAAAELRQRVRAKLEEEAGRHPCDMHWQEQIALFESAYIGTLHSFCLRLVREHFHQLELDPQLSVLAEAEARILAEDTLEVLFQNYYAGRNSLAEAVQQLIQTHGRGWDVPIRRLVLHLHHYTQTLPDPAAWFRRQLALFQTPDPVVWQQWLLDGAMDWRNRWAQHVEKIAASNNGIALECCKALSQFSAVATRSQTAAALRAIVEAKESCPRGKMGAWLESLNHFFEEARFLLSLAQISEPEKAKNSATVDPLVEDWGWVRFQMITLLQLVQQFTESLAQSKRELGVVDFHDLEQHALRLLWDNKTNQPTGIAQTWRKRLRFVLVDEYQDINAAQDKIIEALGREGPQANRFLVGDVKQSIYRFRLANPYIFQGYLEKWGHGEGKTIPLADNFRSCEGILDFVNVLFSSLMHRELGGVEYDEDARLRCGAASERKALAAAGSSAPCVELHLRIKPDAHNEDGETSEAQAELIQLEEAAKEARLVALRLQELKARLHTVWDEASGKPRPVDWRDMAILLRAPTNKAESYAKEFSRHSIPLQVARGGFYRSSEVSDLLSLLQILDNPLQDLPLLAVLHSPLVGLSLNELATVRLCAPKAHFWTALTRWGDVQNPKSRVQSPESKVHSHEFTLHGPQLRTPLPEGDSAADETYRKVLTFVEGFGRWRRLARQISLARCLEAVLSETHYADWLLTQPRGELRQANVQRLVTMAQEFDQFQRQGLFRFLRFIEAQQLAETEPEIAGVSEQNAVRLMSIHQSKGLEFPVVVVADLGKPFNLLDLRAEIILDEKYGLCPHIKPPHTARRYPSLPYWLARQRQTQELLGEELRLLYVATTRARDLLILSGSISRAKFDRFRRPKPVSEARSYTDWLGPWFVRNVGSAGEIPEQGRNDLLRWFIRNDTHLIDSEAKRPVQQEAPATAPSPEPEVVQQLKQRLAWHYPFIAATRQPAKLSVSALRRRANANEDFAAGRFRERAGRPRRGVDSRLQTVNSGPWSGDPNAQPSAVGIGLANHTFLQLVLLDEVDSVAGLKRESERLQRTGALSSSESGLLDLEGIAAFWNSDLGRRIRAQGQFVQRELAFAARFFPNDLAGFFGQPVEPSLDQEYIIVRGAADLAVILPAEIWLVDFKTDAVRKDELPHKIRQYEPQLKLYARALSAIYHRPVSESWLYFVVLRQAVPIP